VTRLSVVPTLDPHHIFPLSLLLNEEMETTNIQLYNPIPEFESIHGRIRLAPVSGALCLDSRNPSAVRRPCDSPSMHTVRPQIHPEKDGDMLLLQGALPVPVFALDASCGSALCSRKRIEGVRPETRAEGQHCSTRRGCRAMCWKSSRRISPQACR
jgi:hypothetical protein